MTTVRRPILAIVYGEASVSAMALSAAAADLCDIVWVVDSGQMGKWLLRLIGKLGTLVDVAGLSAAAAAEAVRLQRPDGIVAYADEHIGRATALAEVLGLDYFDTVVAGRLLDKVTQRQALDDGGLPVPRCLAVPRHPTRHDAEALAAKVEFPVVLKPRHGSASRETHFVPDATQLGDLFSELSTTDPDLDMVIEEYMAAASPSPSSHFGDYVSVESVITHGHISHAAVTGRLPAAKPFRETGLIIPTDFPAALVKDILDVATRAITALGIRIGCLHTEIKVTDKGLRVIEVNGRLGGFVPQTLSLAAPDVNLIEISQRVALGQRVVFEDLVPTMHVGYVVVGQPPLGASTVTSIEGLDQVADYPGVDAVSLSRQPGDAVDWRKGSHEYVFSVLGTAPDHDSVQAVERHIADKVTVSYGWES
jgi:biotin carboxylase